jgi:hypothetical protein
MYKEEKKKLELINHLLTVVLIVGMVVAILDGLAYSDLSEVSFIGFIICLLLPIFKVFIWRKLRKVDQFSKVDNSEREFSSWGSKENNMGKTDEVNDVYSSVRTFKKNKNRVKIGNPVNLKENLKRFPAFSFIASGTMIFSYAHYNHISMNTTWIIVIAGVIGLGSGFVFYIKDYRVIAPIMIGASIAIYIGGAIIGINKEFDGAPASVTNPVIINVERIVIPTIDRRRADRVHYYGTIFDEDTLETVRMRVSRSTYNAHRYNEPADGRRIMDGDLDRVVLVERRGALGFGFRYIVPEDRVYQYIDYIEDLSSE